MCGEFTGHRWNPLIKSSDAELWCFFYLRLNKRFIKQSRRRWFETPSRSLWRHCNYQFLSWYPSLSMMTSSNGIIFRVTGPLCGEFTGHRWSPLTKASGAELWCCFFICAWTNGSLNNRGADDLRPHRVHYDVTVITNLCPDIHLCRLTCHWSGLWLGAEFGEINNLLKIMYQVHISL